VSNRERALELTQDVFMKAWDSVSKGADIKNWKAFLFRILKNLIIDEYRKNKDSSLDMILEQDGVNEGHFAELHTDASETIYRLDTQADIKELYDALNTLSDTYKELIVLRHINELSVTEISNILDKPPNNISVGINRAMHALKAALENKKVSQKEV
jgi:RNA polymerase sigma-70 factor (ECF subfamily)